LILFGSIIYVKFTISILGTTEHYEMRTAVYFLDDFLVQLHIHSCIRFARKSERAKSKNSFMMVTRTHTKFVYIFRIVGFKKYSVGICLVVDLTRGRFDEHSVAQFNPFGASGNQV
jgi:hypothetical protein